MHDKQIAGSIEEHCDVLVIGGGPGGSTVSALLARQGWSVMLLEKDHHPRFHIGESLLPMNLPVLERLGVLEKVRALRMYKAGADFEADNEHGYNTYAFARALGISPPHAFQVWRQDFDRMLFEHARAQGVDAREGSEVIAVQQHGPRDSAIEVRADDGRVYTVQTCYVWLTPAAATHFLPAARSCDVKTCSTKALRYSDISAARPTVPVSTREISASTISNTAGCG